MKPPIIENLVEITIRAFKHRRVRDCETGFQGGEVNK
jgi:hypothetical protein